MRKLKVFVLAVCLATLAISLPAAADKKESVKNIQSQEMIATIVSIDIQNSTIDLQYEFDDQTHQSKTDTFYITDATIIDIAMVKSTLQDLKAGVNVLVEYAQMADGAKVIESVWVKKS